MHSYKMYEILSVLNIFFAQRTKKDLDPVSQTYDFFYFELFDQ